MSGKSLSEITLFRLQSFTRLESCSGVGRRSKDEGPRGMGSKEIGESWTYPGVLPVRSPCVRFRPVSESLPCGAP